MKSFKLFFRLLTFTGLIFLGCKSDASKNENSNSDEEKNEETSLQEMEKSMEELGKGSGEVVDFKILKDALPETLGGLKRTSHTGSKTSFATLKISTAQANYSEGDKSIDATITDTGGLGMALAGLAAWSSMEMESEDDNGYERTTTIDGHKAFEKYDKTNNYGEVSVIYNNRFIVSLNGRNVSMDDLHDAVKKIDIKT